MNYKEALEYIHSIPKFMRPLGNARLSGLLDALGNPHRGMKYVHIAGTNGKGSTAAMTAEILRRAGFRTGLFTSPFIEVFNERIQINGENIGDSALAAYTERVKNASEASGCAVSEFAFITAIAFLYFKEERCDIVVLETGMGGKLDATNIIDCPAAAVITSISLDHTQYLGDTIEEIAAEKCGIIKHGGTVVTSAGENALNIIEHFAKENHAKLIKTEKAYASENGFIYKGSEYPLALKGAYQPQNAAAALETVSVLRASGMNIPGSAVCEGLAKVRWPARFEFLSGSLVIDGGHNPDGIRALSRSLKNDGREVVLVAAMMDDKNYKECAEELSRCAEYIITTELKIPRCLSAVRLLECMRASGEAEPDPKTALKKALAMAGREKLVCVCGSLYLAGEVRSLISSGQITLPAK